jgi:hypothetical protein
MVSRPYESTSDQSGKKEPVFRLTSTSPLERTISDGHQGVLTEYTRPGESWRATGYDRVLQDACQSSGYPCHLASHDLRSLAVVSAMNDASKSGYRALLSTGS